MSFEYKVYSREQGRWQLLAGFNFIEGAKWFCMYYLNLFEVVKPELKVMHGKRKILEY